MRYADILNEAHPDYAAMFRFISLLARDVTLTGRAGLADIEAVQHLDNILDKANERAKFEIKWARKHLKRYDRIIWWLRSVKAFLARSLIERLATIPEGKAPGLVAKITEVANNIIAKFEARAGRNIRDDYRIWESGGAYMIFDHFYSLPISVIQDYRPQNESLRGLTRLFNAAEKKWQISRKGLLPRDERDGRVLLRFRSGLVWMQLDRPACRQEGDAMGHCGNLADQKEGDTLLSLREPVEKNGNRFWKPYLTFILDANGHLGEMKGRFNKKPRLAYQNGDAPSDFQDEIEALLRLPIVKGIKGGGYAPEQNFALSDFDDERRAKLLRDAPHLISPVALDGTDDE
jgi:hypothetical protein